MMFVFFFFLDLDNSGRSVGNYVLNHFYLLVFSFVSHFLRVSRLQDSCVFFHGPLTILLNLLSIIKLFLVKSGL